MPYLTQVVFAIDSIIMPLIACVALLMSKVIRGELARWAERQFLATLVVITLVTLRTVIHCDDAWLVHTMTLASMVVGALLIPNLDSSVMTIPRS